LQQLLATLNLAIASVAIGPHLINMYMHVIQIFQPSLASEDCEMVHGHMAVEEIALSIQ
jgi:hypothetical protein